MTKSTKKMIQAMILGFSPSMARFLLMQTSLSWLLAGRPTGCPPASVL